MDSELLRHLEEQVEACLRERNGLPAQYEKLKEQHDTVVSEIQSEAAGKVKAAGDELEKLRRQVQSRADFLAGKVDALRHLIERMKAEQAAVVVKPQAAPVPAQPMSAHEMSGSEVYNHEDEQYEDEGDEQYEDEGDEQYEDEGDTASDPEGDDIDPDDDIADAIENAPNEETVRALLARYRKA